jgi:serine/threonine protein kinase
MVALGLGVECEHPANKQDGKNFKIPSRRYSCEHFERRDPPGGKVTVEGDTAKIELTIHGGAPFIGVLGMTAVMVAQKVYEVAKANPSTKKAEVKLTMSRRGLKDKYGNEWTEDRENLGRLLAELGLNWDESNLRHEIEPPQLGKPLFSEDPELALTFAGTQVLPEKTVDVVIKFPAASDPSGWPRMLLDEKLLALRHEADVLDKATREKIPHFVRLLDDQTRGQLPFLVMERLGENLSQRLKQREGAGAKGLPLRDCLVLLRDVADALAGLHRLGIFHNDVKPDNVLKCADGWSLIDPAPSDLYTAQYRDRRYPEGPPRDVLALGLTFLVAYLGEEGETAIDDEYPELEDPPELRRLLRRMLGQGRMGPPPATDVGRIASSLLRKGLGLESRRGGPG